MCVKMQGCVAVAFVWYCMLIQLTSLSAGTPKDSVAKQLLDSSAAVDVYFKGALIYYSFIGTCNKKNVTSTLNVCVHVASCQACLSCAVVLLKCTPDSINEGPETERSTDNLLCFPAEHTVYPMTVKTATNRFALKKRFSQFVTLDAQVSVVAHSASAEMCS